MVEVSAKISRQCFDLPDNLQIVYLADRIVRIVDIDSIRRL